jgi:aspartyl-tRNA(Asn)/glutamyl-tRNA(Gln) amidotransferase subunit C
MTIDDRLFRHLEVLSKLTVSESEREKIKADIEQILTYMKCLDEVDVQDVRPMTSPIEEVNRLRNDEIAQKTLPEQLLENAPELDEGFVVVRGKR